MMDLSLQYDVGLLVFRAAYYEWHNVNALRPPVSILWNTERNVCNFFLKIFWGT